MSPAPAALISLIALACSASATAGNIDLGTPVTSGVASSSAPQQRRVETDLSTAQLQGITDWLADHRSGWRGMITPATNEPVELKLILNHRDGTHTSLSLVTRPNSGPYLRLTGPGQWAYHSFFGFWKSWAATREISATDLAGLEKLLGAPTPNP
jgi:hypothetical protein